jgi:DNA-binding GntR family transcriptional regulator
VETEYTFRVTVEELRAHTLTGVVQREIEVMILSGELVPGERLNEELVVDTLMVSRGPVVVKRVFVT